MNDLKFAFRQLLKNPGFAAVAALTLALLALCLAAVPAFAASSSVLDQATRGIETHRKGDATIRFVRKDGVPISGLKVEINQHTHDFAFGNLIRPRHYNNEQYRARFLELFNFIQLLEFNWGQYEREEGKPQLAGRREFIEGWCHTNGLTRFYGHMLTWSYQLDEPRDIGPVNPFWLFRHDRDTQFRLLKERIQHRELVEALKKEKAPLHAIGIQAHSPGNGAHWFSPEEIWQTCELFGVELGLPIYFTEFWQVSDPQRKMSGARSGGNWSPELQADAIEQFHRVAFGHPAVEAIIYFGMIDGETESPALGLLDANFQPKPAWTRLKKLIKEEWNTRQSATTDAAGVVGFHGFFGQYDVRVTDAGKQRSFTAHLERAKPNEWRFTVE